MRTTNMRSRWRLYRNLAWIQPILRRFGKPFVERTTPNRNDSSPMKNKLTPEDLDARLKFVVGCVLAGVLTITTIGVLYALVFVTQPIGAQAENDKMFFSVLSSVATFITGTLAGLMISTGRNSKDNETPNNEEIV